MAGGTTNYTITESGVFHAPLTLTFPYHRTVGPTISRFLTGLRDGVVIGTRTSDGRVVVPAAEFDVITGAALTEFVQVADTGMVTAWSWVPEALAGQPLGVPFAFALIVLDGADIAMVHAVDCGSPDSIATGSRVKARWAIDRIGAMSDLICFELIP